jgi:hypothetical protein
MVKIEEGSRFKREIEELSRISIKGRLFDDAKEDTIVIGINNSLFEISREHITNISKIKSDQEANLVSVSLTSDAKIIQKQLVSVDQMASVGDDEGWYIGQGFTKVNLGHGVVGYIDDTGFHLIWKKPKPGLGVSEVNGSLTY